MSADPDMAGLIGAFVGDLRKRVRALEVAYATNDVDTLKQLAHQLKGASGGYGFDVIGEAAAELESVAATADSVSALADEMETLASLCRRATADAPPGLD
jgi:HPt (histidine-containing phosphotransfer) domain-containing protein